VVSRAAGSRQRWLEAAGRVLGAVAAAALVLVGGPLAAQVAPPDENEIQGRGFSPEKLYQFQDIDSINLFAGSLALSVPLGPSYPVNGALSYQFRLAYNSGVWTYHEKDCDAQETQLEGIPNILSNAGLGFMVTFGYLIPPTHDPLNEHHDWLYVGPDGAQTYLWDTLHEEDADESAADWFSRDGTFLRLQLGVGAGGVHELEFPDGTIHTFEAGVHDSTIFEVTQIRDAFGNTIAIDRTAPDTNHWEVSDGHRLHQIVFQPSGAPELPRPQIASITLDAFGGQDAIYTFTYADLPQSSVDRGCRDTCDGNSPMVSVPLLVALTLPSGEQYTLGTAQAPDYETSCGNSSGGPSGRLRSVTLPTLGEIAYTWGSFCTPRQKACDTGDPPEPPQGAAFTCDAAVAVRELFDPADVSAGQWQYDNGIYPPPVDCNEPATETRTVVVAPTGECTKHYFAAYPHLDVSQSWSFGLPFSPLNASGALFLSTESWESSVPIAEPLVQFLQLDCISDPEGSPLRSSYALYTHDTLGDGGTDGSGYHNSNRRLEQTKTVYHDAEHCGAGSATCEATSVSSNYDANGHYRQTVYGGNFPGTNDRTSLTNFNPTWGTYPGTHAHPAADDAWILGTYDKTEVTEGADTARVEYCFDEAKGVVLRRRNLLDTVPPLSIDGNDVLAVFEYGNSGNLTRERYFGGDTDPDISTAAVPLCDLALPAGANVFDYQLEHVYRYGALEKTFYATTDGGATIGFNVFDVDRDPSTGLVARSRDSSGLIPTDYLYDPMGRLIAEVPAEDPAQRARTDYTYTNALGLDPARVTVEKTDITSGTLLAESEYEFDGFGRVALEGRKMEDGSFAERTTTYNARGWPLTKSEWDPACAPPCGITTFSNYDPFGRPGTIAAPDGTQTTFVYEGVSQVDRIVNIQGAGNVTTRELYDRFGRLRSVEEPVGAANGFTYSYDEGDRLVEVTSDPGAAEQTRTFEYDGRGFLLSETHPELGGTDTPPEDPEPVVYSNHDARGHAGRREQRDTLGGAFQRVDFLYDKAERLTTVTDALTARALKNFAYDDPGGVSRLDGRLRQAIRHNWVNAPWDGTATETDVTVTETYAYDGAGAAVSRRTTNTNREGLQFVVDWTYTPLGDVATIVYPDCQVATTCPSGEPARTVKNSYTNGFVTAVGTPGVPGVYAQEITYHPNGLWSTVRHQATGNGVLDVQTIASDGTRRPQRLQVTNVASGTPFDTGAYGYDGMGNVTAMGTDTFAYDDRSRLKEANVHGYEQDFTYDFYGNLVSYDTTPPGGSVATTTISTDILTNRLTGAEPGATYDAAGNLTVLAGNVYRYDPLNMETHRNPGFLDPQWTNIYTADDERLWILVHGGGPPPGEFVTESGSGQALYVRDLSGKVLRRYWKYHPNEPPDPNQPWNWREDLVYRGATLLAAPKQGTSVRHYHTDHLGTIRQTTDVQRKVLDSRDYLPFGEGAPLSADGQALQFTGQERDMHWTGELDNLDYMHARYRSPVYARFLSVDPIVNVRRSSRRPQSWNRYSYALDNPLKYVDPTGRIFVLSGCATKSEAKCEEQAKLLYDTLGKQASQHISLNTRTGVVSVVGMSTRAFGQKFGTLARGLGELIGSRDIFSLITDNPQMAARGQGAYTDPLRGGGANIYIDPSRFPMNAGGVRQTTSTAMAHETGHAVGGIFRGLASSINDLAFGPNQILLHWKEGYPVTFENRYRAEAGLGNQREYYATYGDYLDPGDVSLFPED
jgi:RHS repeat-associated protein